MGGIHKQLAKAACTDLPSTDLGIYQFGADIHGQQNESMASRTYAFFGVSMAALVGVLTCNIPPESFGFTAYG